METNYRYYVFKDAVDLNDDGEEQASIYRTMIDTASPMQVDQIIEKAEQNADWKIAFGEGDWNLIDKYTIEEKGSAGNTKVIAEQYKPAP
jgi:hypothetical protein